MRKTTFFISFLLYAWVLPAQNGLYLSPGANLFISPGTPLAVDSLVLTPLAGYNITGANSVLRAATTTHATGNSYIQRVYRWNATLPPFTGNLSFYYRDGELNGINENALTLNVHNGTSWNAYINNVVRDINNNFVTTPLLNVSLNELTLASVTGALPMNWLGVEAIKQNGLVSVNWRTANEINCAWYQVEKSSNGLDWSGLGAHVAAYNTPGPNYYTLTDAVLPAPVSYYRIRQTDLDAKYSYSIVVSVKGDRTNTTLLYPIPAGEVLNIAAGGGLLLKSVKVYSAGGSLVAAERPAGASLLAMDVHGLAAGNYTAVIVLSDNSTITRSFIKQ
ncbi:MAG TPA: T9SS type A sorting domain-containing protein [Chitinophagaceae bacterium]|nr:T9SS type A sorting domain-containing protein [Chitinophagaceae bacterium]